ncbi:hypothetical protein CASFOL_020370 [Castilleja foliolosa]|uniref:GRAM domain-containing protein n=1 Tax=Castilleja foliolosa TaxID=1961234 RepID=A0ABD3D1F0_9LAMI
MELNHNISRIGKKNVLKEHVIGIPISSAACAFSLKRSQKSLLLDSTAAQYQLMPSPSKRYSKIRYRKVDSVIKKMVELGESMDTFAQGLREHVRLGPKFSETVKGKLSLGIRILRIGGVEKVFREKFNIKDDEKLLKASQCYLSTTTGPIAGLLFISNNRIAFCSERSIKVTSPSGKLLKVHYKVMIPLGKIKRAVEIESVKKPTQKYVQIVTEDNFEFWFMGFLNHRRTLNYLQEVLEFLI